jgi:pyridoxine kinase
MSILSIQSAVAYGHVGNSAVVLPLQLLGFEVWPVDTVQFSNHPGYGAWRGHIASAKEVADILMGIVERGVLHCCEAVLSGYLGQPGTGHAVLGAVAHVKAANPAALYCCDPVFGDHPKGLYAKPGIAEFFRDTALPLADIATPNHFELEWLTGRSIASLDDGLAALRLLRERGPRTVIVTSLRRAEASPQETEMLALGDEGAFLLATPLLPAEIHGLGDLFAALFLAALLRKQTTEAALVTAGSSVFAIAEATQRAGGGELPLVQSRDLILAPPRLFAARRVG